MAARSVPKRAWNWDDAGLVGYDGVDDDQIQLDSDMDALAGPTGGRAISAERSDRAS